MSLRPTSYAAAKARHVPLKRSGFKRAPVSTSKEQKASLKAEARNRRPLRRSRLKNKSISPAERALRAEVLNRDGNRCQWPGGCTTGDTRIDVHHLAERSQRPDLKLSADNCKAICRTHHDWIPLHRAEAIVIGLINPETYEAAQKRKRETA